MSRAFVFPGQGAQTIGMGRALAEAYPAAKAVFDEVDAALGEKLSALIWDGDIDDADADPQRPARADGHLHGRPARARGRRRSGIDAAALSPGIRWANTRRFAPRGRSPSPTPRACCACAGEAMQAAVAGRAWARWPPSSASGSTTSRAVAAEAARARSAEAANDNDPAQVVVSGHAAGVDRAVEIAKARGAKRALLLPVSAPFHCALMAARRRVMAEALAAVAIRAPAVPVVANVRGRRR